MQAEGIYLKKIDRQAYRRLKAMAAERGQPVYSILNEALAEYLVGANSGPVGKKAEAILTIEDEDNVAFRKAESDPSMKGRWVGVARGSVVILGDSEAQVAGEMAKAYKKRPFLHAIIGKVGEVREERDWLAGSLRRA